MQTCNRIHVPEREQEKMKINAILSKQRFVDGEALLLIFQNLSLLMIFKQEKFCSEIVEDAWLFNLNIIKCWSLVSLIPYEKDEEVIKKIDPISLSLRHIWLSIARFFLLNIHILSKARGFITCTSPGLVLTFSQCFEICHPGLDFKIFGSIVQKYIAKNTGRVAYFSILLLPSRHMWLISPNKRGVVMVDECTMYNVYSN